MEAESENKNFDKILKAVLFQDQEPTLDFNTSLFEEPFTDYHSEDNNIENMNEMNHELQESILDDEKVEIQKVAEKTEKRGEVRKI